MSILIHMRKMGIAVAACVLMATAAYAEEQTQELPAELPPAGKASSQTDAVIDGPAEEGTASGALLRDSAGSPEEGGTHDAEAAPEAAHDSGGHGQQEAKQIIWPFSGPLGTFDKVSIQRGLQVYREVCAACHGLTRVPFRKLTEVGFSEEETKALAAEYTYTDGPNDDGEMFERPGRPSDKFPSPYANEKAARSVNNGAFPPDLSLIIKARPDGANYLYSLLTGYQDAPHGMEVPEGMHYNPYFPGGLIAMPQPLHDNQVSYQDNTNASLDQEARDLVNFLQWAAEPEMEIRKRMGLKVMIFLALMTFFFYLAKRSVWKDLH